MVCVCVWWFFLDCDDEDEENDEDEESDEAAHRSHTSAAPDIRGLTRRRVAQRGCSACDSTRLPIE